MLQATGRQVLYDFTCFSASPDYKHDLRAIDFRRMLFADVCHDAGFPLRVVADGPGGLRFTIRLRS